MTRTEREELIRRIRTPLTPQQVYELKKQGALKSSVLYRTCRKPIRSSDGRRLFDLVYDTDTEEHVVTLKQGKEYYNVPLEYMLKQFHEMETDDPEKRIS